MKHSHHKTFQALLWRKTMHRAHTTMLDAHPTIFCFRVSGLFPSFEFVVEFWVFIDWSHSNIPHTHHDARRPPHDFSFLSFPRTNFPGTIFSGTIFLGDHFSEDHFSRGPVFGDHFSGDHFSGIQHIFNIF